MTLDAFARSSMTRLLGRLLLVGLMALGLVEAVSVTSAISQAPNTQCIASASAQGTPDAITIAALPCALTTNLLLLTASGPNATTAPTLQPLGLSAQRIVRQDGSALMVGDIPTSGAKVLLTPTGSVWVLLNPAAPVPGQNVKLPTGVTNFYANSAGSGCGGGGCSDANDGLTPLTATKTVLGAAYNVLNRYSFTCEVVLQTTVKINLLANEVNAGAPFHFGPHDYAQACAGGQVLIDGGGIFTYEYDSASGNGPFSLFFGPSVELQNLTIVNTLGPCVVESEHASVRIGAGVVIGNCGIGFQIGSSSVLTLLNGLTVTTLPTVSALFSLSQGGQMVGAGTIAFTTISGYSDATVVNIGGGVDLAGISWSGGVGVTGRSYDNNSGGNIVNGAGSIPGNVSGRNLSGATVDGGPVALTAGGTGSGAFQATGSWTPTDGSGAGLNFVGSVGGYTLIGNMAFVYGSLTYPGTTSGSTAVISGFPVPFIASQYGRQCGLTSAGTVSSVTQLVPNASGTTVAPETNAGVTVANSVLSTATVLFECVYPMQ